MLRMALRRTAMLLTRILLGATFLVVVGYFVLLTSSRTEGALRTFGKYLGIWLVVLAGLFIIGGATMAHRHGGPGMMHGQGMQRPWFGRHGPRPGPRPDEGPPPAPAPGAGTPPPAPNAAPTSP